MRAQASIRRAPKESGARAAPRKAALLRQSPAEPSPTQLQLAKAAMLEAKVRWGAGCAAATPPGLWNVALPAYRVDVRCLCGRESVGSV